MKLQNAKSTFPMPLKVLYGTTYILCAVVLYYALFFSDYLLSLKLAPFASAIIAGVTLLTPLVFMPLIYGLIARVKAKTLGRYHIPLILSTLAAALSNATLSNVLSQTSRVGSALNLIFSLLIFSVFLLLFMHSCISVGDRIGVETSGGKGVLRYLFALIGVVAFFVGVAFLPREMFYQNLSYIMSVLILLAGMGVYLTTFTAIPKFAAADKKLPPKPVFQDFFSPMKSRYGVMSLFSIVFSLAAALLFLGNHSVLLAPFADLSYLNLGFWILSLCAGAIVTILASLKVKNAKPRIKHVYMAVMCVFMAVAAILMMLTQYIPMTLAIKSTLFIIITVLASIASGGFISIAGFSLRAVRAISNTSKGKMFSLTNALICALFGAVFALSVVIRAYMPLVSLSVVVLTSLIISTSVIALALYLLKGKTKEPLEGENSAKKHSLEEQAVSEGGAEHDTNQ